MVALNIVLVLSLIHILKLIHDSDNVACFGTQFSHSVALHFQTDLLMLEKFTMAYIEQTSPVSYTHLLGHIKAVHFCQFFLSVRLKST